MKKLFLIMMAAMLVLATSCQKEEVLNVETGALAAVSFKVNTPEIATRAFSDGTSATVLQYAVYDANGKILPALTKTDATINGSTTVELQLATGNTYSVIFWAAAPNAPYSVDFNAKTMTVDYTGAVSNDESRDAFYAFHSFTVNGTQSETIELRRPFAQLNIGTADYEASEKAGYVPTKSAVTVKKVYNTLNLAEGTVLGEDVVTFAQADIKKDETFPVPGYEYLAMNYFLVDAEKKVVDVEFTYSDENNNSKTRTVGSVPVQRNYRTNIYGNILTSEVDINVEIKPEYENQFNNEHLYFIEEENTYYIASADGLVYFAEQVNAGSTVFTKAKVALDGDINLSSLTRANDYYEWEPIGTSVNFFEGTFDGKGHKITNFQVTAKEAHAGLFGYARARIKNLNVENVKITANHYAGGIVGQGYCRFDNCNVKNINISLTTKDGDLGDKAGGIIGQNCEGTMHIKNCTAEDVTIKGYRDLGGIAGMAHKNNIVTDCFAKNITIDQDLSVNYEATTPITLGGIVGRIHSSIGVYENNTEENVSVLVRDAEVLAAYLKANTENISVALANDIDLPISSLGTMTGGSGEYKLGGENTKNITINLNGKKLNITTTYWSVIGAKNPNALFTIKNGTMTSSQTSGTWNSYDLSFENCNYSIEDVVFEKAIALSSGAGKVASLKNVTINETHDYYAMWIEANGITVNVDGLIVNSNGRGIKIDEQYVGAPEKVVLNINNAVFNTKKKAAIVVKSVAGAEINASNINISNVIADTQFAVWVDEDAKAYADKVTVKGALVKVEGSNDKIISSQEALEVAIANNAKIYLTEGTYVLPNSAQGKTITFIGTGNPLNTKIATNNTTGSYEGCNYALDGSTVVFENISINTPSTTYIGYARCKATYKNCVFNGTYTLYDNSTFENCTFNVSGDVYNIWTWGAPIATFTNCTFNSDGKAMLLYGQANTKLTVNNCVFNDNGGLSDLKAAIEIGNDYNTSYELIVNNTIVNGYEINDKGINTGTTLWANKNSMPQEKLNVVVDGVDVY